MSPGRVARSGQTGKMAERGLFQFDRLECVAQIAIDDQPPAAGARPDSIRSRAACAARCSS
jgi:hypothetical protein